MAFDATEQPQTAALPLRASLLSVFTVSFDSVSSLFFSFFCASVLPVARVL
jgi:hypothetical protein